MRGKGPSFGKGDGRRARFHPTRAAQGQPAAAKGKRFERAPLPPPPPPAAPAVNATQFSAGVQTVTVTPDESGMRVDRFFEARFPGLSFSHIQRIIRKGEVRVNGKRTQPKARLRSRPGGAHPAAQARRRPTPRDDAPQSQKDRAFLKSITLYEDDDVLVLNKPMGLAVQGGSGTMRHLDGMLGALRGSQPDAQRPRLVHRLDKDTAGCLLVAKTRFAAAALAKTFRTRSARKIYWALVAGVPKPKQGRISTYLAKEEVEEDSFMRIAKHGDKDAMHAVTYYAVVETAAQKLSWISLKPVTGRTHQLRAHMAHVGNPIIGDPKYFNIENWELPGGIQDKLHLLARRIVVPHPRGGDNRRHGAVAAAHAADLEPARLRRQALRPHRRGAGGVAAGCRRAYLMAMLRGFLITFLLLALAAPALSAEPEPDNGTISIMRPEPDQAPPAQKPPRKARRGSSNPVYPTPLPGPQAPLPVPHREAVTPRGQDVPPALLVPQTGRVLPNLPPRRARSGDLAGQVRALRASGRRLRPGATGDPGSYIRSCINQ